MKGILKEKQIILEQGTKLELEACGSDEPNCPRCKHGNAMLHNTRETEDGGYIDVLWCRDCGVWIPYYVNKDYPYNELNFNVTELEFNKETRKWERPASTNCKYCDCDLDITEQETNNEKYGIPMDECRNCYKQEMEHIDNTKFGL